MKKIFQFVKSILTIGILTITTQIGGVIYILYKILLTKKFAQLKNRKSRYLGFLALYLVVSIFIIPITAKQFGRVALPYFATKDFPLKPANIIYCLLNRNYVTAEMKKTIQAIAVDYNKLNPNEKLVYLDANFPFIDDFPLLPHRSHDDGEKLDLNFIYKDQQGNRISKSPNLIGYGFCEKPQKGEIDKPLDCKNQGYWQYNLLNQLISNWNRSKYTFDQEANKALLKIIAKHKSIRKIFIEPHLKQRLKLNGINKIRFHGCKAVRHDDHIHIEL